MGIRSALAFAAIAAVLHGVVDVNADWPRPAVGMGWQVRTLCTRHQ